MPKSYKEYIGHIPSQYETLTIKVFQGKDIKPVILIILVKDTAQTMLLTNTTLAQAYHGTSSSCRIGSASSRGGHNDSITLYLKDMT